MIGPTGFNNPLWTDTTKDEFEAAVEAHLLVQGTQVVHEVPDDAWRVTMHYRRLLVSRPESGLPSLYGITLEDPPNASTVAKSIRLVMTKRRQTHVYGIDADMDKDQPRVVKGISYWLFS